MLSSRHNARIKMEHFNFGYRINFKYEGMPSYSFNGFCVVTRFVLHRIEDLMFTTIQFDNSCEYLGTGKHRSDYPSNYIPNLTVYCKMIVPYIEHLYKKQVAYYDKTAY